MLYPLKKNLHSSVRPCVCLSVRASFLGSIDQFSSNFVYEFISGRSDYGLQMDKFQQLSTEIWPLIYINILFPFSFYAFIDRFSSNFL